MGFWENYIGKVAVKKLYWDFSELIMRIQSYVTMNLIKKYLD